MKFEIYDDASGNHRWRLVDEDGRLLAIGSGGFASRAKALLAAENVRAQAGDAQITEEAS